MRPRIAVGHSLAVVFSAVSLAHAQARGGLAAAASGMIDGVVSDTSLSPLADATVSIVGTEIRVVTGPSGRFRLLGVSAGRYFLLARRIGYEATTTPIDVAERDTLRLSIALQPVAVSLDTVKVATLDVSPRLAEFYARRKVGPGQFMTEDEIEKLNLVAVPDLLRRFLGIRISWDGTHAASTRSAGCPIMAIVDGIARYSNLRDLPSPKEVAAIEFYKGPSEIPLQFKSMLGDHVSGITGVSCGLILIWTRDGSSAVTRPPR